MPKIKSINLGTTTVTTGMVLKKITGLVVLAKDVPGEAKLENYTLGIVKPPLGAQGRLKLSLGATGLACAVTVTGMAGIFPQSEVVNIPRGGGDVSTVKSYSSLRSLSTDVAPGDLLQVSMEVQATQRAASGDKGLVVAASDAVAGASVLYSADGEQLVRCDPGLAPSIGDEIVAADGGLGRKKGLGDTGDVLGTVARAEIITQSGKSFVPMDLT